MQYVTLILQRNTIILTTVSENKFVIISQVVNEKRKYLRICNKRL